MSLTASWATSTPSGGALRGREAYRKAAENNPKRAEIQWRWVDLYAAEDYPALSKRSPGRELAPTDPAIPNWLHIVFRQTGRYDEAIRPSTKPSTW